MRTATRTATRIVIALLASIALSSMLSSCAYMARNGQRATGLPGNDAPTLGPNLSTDGRYVVFGSRATNLVPGDTNGVSDAFLQDRATSVTERISVSTAAVQGNGPLDDEPTVSDDGDVVAFASFAANLDPNCSDTVGQIFVRTRSAGTTECISIDAGGTEGNANSGEPHISADGRYVAFDSEASNLVAGDTNATQDIFVRDLVTDTTERVNLQRNGTQSAGWGFWPDISDHGRYVAYRSSAGDLDPDCPGVSSQVYVTDLRNDTNECVSVDAAGVPGDDYSDQPRLSGDGRYVAFFSAADNLDPACSGGSAPVATQAYLRDRDTGTTTCESIDASGAPGDADTLFPELSGDGRTMSFLSSATNLDAHCPNTTVGVRPEMFVRDLDSHVNTCVSVDATGQAAGSVFNSGSLSGTGALVAFESYAALTPDDSNGLGDMFVRDTVAGVTTIASAASVEPDADVIGPDLSDDGRYLAFASGATNLVPNDSAGFRDIFRRDQLTGAVTRLSVTTLLGIDFPANGASRNPSISGNGAATAFVSDATNLVPADTNGASDIFVREPGARTTARVSVSGGAVQANGASSEPAISANGRYVAFESTATNLDPNCAGALTSIYVRDRSTGSTSCFAPFIGGFRTQISGSAPSISADGRYVALRTTPGGVTPCGVPGWIVVWDRTAGTFDCVAPGNQADISGSGASVAFTSSDPTLAAPCTNGIDQIFVATLATNTITCASASRSGAAGNGASGVPSITADGRYVAFRTAATNLVFPDADTNGRADVVVHDMTLDWTSFASRDAFVAGGNGGSDAPAFAADGALLALQSDASDLVEGDTLGHTDVFVRAARALWLDSSSLQLVGRGSTVTVTLHGLGFRPETVLSPDEGITLANATYVSPEEFRVDVTAAADAPLVAMDIGVQNPGPAWNSILLTYGVCTCVRVV